MPPESLSKQQVDNQKHHLSVVFKLTHDFHVSKQLQTKETRMLLVLPVAPHGVRAVIAAFEAWGSALPRLS